jgi:hypothetical protein
LGNEKAASANADQQHDDGGNLKPVHFLAQIDQPAAKITPSAPMISTSASAGSGGAADDGGRLMRGGNVGVS